MASVLFCMDMWLILILQPTERHPQLTSVVPRAHLYVGHIRVSHRPAMAVYFAFTFPGGAIDEVSNTRT